MSAAVVGQIIGYCVLAMIVIGSISHIVKTRKKKYEIKDDRVKPPN